MSRKIADPHFSHMIVSQISERFLTSAPQERRFVHLLERHMHDVRERYNARKTITENRHDMCDTLLLAVRVSVCVCTCPSAILRCAYQHKISVAHAVTVAV
jgi:hypothetical protein